MKISNNIVAFTLAALFSPLVLAAGSCTCPGGLAPLPPPPPTPTYLSRNKILNNKGQVLVTCDIEAEDEQLNDAFNPSKYTLNDKQLLANLTCAEVAYQCTNNNVCVGSYAVAIAKSYCEKQYGVFDSAANDNCLKSQKCIPKGGKCTEVTPCCSMNCGRPSNVLTPYGKVPEPVCLDPKPVPPPPKPPLCCYGKPYWPSTNEVKVLSEESCPTIGCPIFRNGPSGIFLLSCKTCACPTYRRNGKFIGQSKIGYPC